MLASSRKARAETAATNQNWAQQAAPYESQRAQPRVAVPQTAKSVPACGRQASSRERSGTQNARCAQEDKLEKEREREAAMVSGHDSPITSYGAMRNVPEAST